MATTTSEFHVILASLINIILYIVVYCGKVSWRAKSGSS